MKLIKIFLILVILLSCFQTCVGQEKAKANLIDRFSNISLGDLWSRIDGFVYLLSQNPGSNGYVVIYPGKDSIKQDFRLEKRFKKLIINRFYQLKHFDENRVAIVRSQEKDELEIELWEVEPKAEKPFSIVDMWAEKPVNLTKPFVFGTAYDEAYPSFAPGLYAKLLKENENLRGHIVIFNTSKKEARSIKEEWLKLFTEEYKVPRNRLKIFYGKNKGIPDVEFWVVPRK
jgi:hypothetical protein